ncbi:MAG: divergent polysaccharide deacetylase family protein [Candidatus Omnitrophota bacterium]
MKTKIIMAAVVVLALCAAWILWHRASGTVKIRYAPGKREAPRAVAKKGEPLPQITKRFNNPKIAIVMDDFGYNMNNIEAFFAIKKPVTLSILPNLPHSRQIEEMARARGYETILHLPLEPHGKGVGLEKGTINSAMSDREVLAQLGEDLDGLPGIKGVSNHMGSKATEERPLMALIIGELKSRNMYFFDSVTSDKSVCRSVAKEAGVRCARRNVFLDMGKADDPNYIKKQVLELRRFAFKNGRAIAVCHDRKNTVKVLAEMMPLLARDGVRFVYLSELVN